MSDPYDKREELAARGLDSRRAPHAPPPAPTAPELDVLAPLPPSLMQGLVVLRAELMERQLDASTSYETELCESRIAMLNRVMQALRDKDALAALLVEEERLVQGRVSQYEDHTERRIAAQSIINEARARLRALREGA